MNIVYKTSPELGAYGFAALLAFLLLQRFGKEATIWILNRLYDFFIRNNPVEI